MIAQSNISPLSDDLKFLILCCQIELSQDDNVFIQAYIKSESLDTHSLIKLASQHGILPLIYKTLKKLLDNNVSIPDGLLISFKNIYMDISKRNMLMSSELIRIMRLLGKNNIRALAFKGPLLAQIAYKDITLRQYSDLDILIPEKDTLKAGTIIFDNGYEPINSMNILTNPICLKIDKDFAFINTSNYILVEMHWRLVPKNLNTHFDFKKLHTNQQTILLNNVNLPSLSSEDLLIYLCIHGSKHAWERIEWVCDIDRLIHNNDINWDIILEYITTQTDYRPILLGLLTSKRLFHTPIPTDMIHLATQEADLEHLYLDVLSFYTRSTISNDTFQRIYLIQAFVNRVFHKKNNKVLTFFKQIFTISRRDCQYFVLPKKLKFFYIILRPFRLIYTRLTAPLNHNDK